MHRSKKPLVVPDCDRAADVVAELKAMLLKSIASLMPTGDSKLATVTGKAGSQLPVSDPGGMLA